MNNLQLKAARQGLGLTVAEAASLPNIDVSKRSFQYYEAGAVAIPEDVALSFDTMISHYNLVLDKMKADIEANTKHQTPEVFAPTVRPVLPFYKDFENFAAATGCPHVTYWRIYQSVISHLYLIGKLNKLDDNAEIPKDYAIWRWLSGDYEMR